MRTRSYGTLATSFKTTLPITSNPTSSTAPTRPSSSGRCRSCCEYIPSIPAQKKILKGDVNLFLCQNQQHGLQREPEANRRQQRVWRPAHDLLPHPPHAESHQAAAAAGRAFALTSPPPSQHELPHWVRKVAVTKARVPSSLSPQTICQKTKDKTAEYFAAVWALHAISKVGGTSTVAHVYRQRAEQSSGVTVGCCFHSWSTAATMGRGGWSGRSRCTPSRNRWSLAKSR